MPPIPVFYDLFLLYLLSNVQFRRSFYSMFLPTIRSVSASLQIFSMFLSPFEPFPMTSEFLLLTHYYPPPMFCLSLPIPTLTPVIPSSENAISFYSIQVIYTLFQSCEFFLLRLHLLLHTSLFQTSLFQIRFEPRIPLSAMLPPLSSLFLTLLLLSYSPPELFLPAPVNYSHQKFSYLSL